MIRKKSAIRKYRSRLPGELLKRYGGGPYTEAQVSTTVSDLGLSRKHIHYAYVLFCAEEVLEEYGIVGDKLRLMLAAVATAGGEYGTFPADHDAGSFADGFGGGDGGGGGD